MSTNASIAIWGCTVTANVHICADNFAFAAAWLVFAAAVYAAAKMKSREPA